MLALLELSFIGTSVWVSVLCKGVVWRALTPTSMVGFWGVLAVALVPSKASEIVSEIGSLACGFLIVAILDVLGAAAFLRGF